MSASLQPGQTAPDFTLYETMQVKHTLSDYKGKPVVLLFFPMAFTGVCTKELCSVRDDIGNYQGLNAQILAISVDSVFTLARFKEENQYPFPLLSDFNKDVSTAYDCIYDSFTDMGMKGVSRRAAFVIDKQGVVLYSHICEHPGLVPDFEAIKSVLAGLS